jgi:hypothetical protein
MNKNITPENVAILKVGKVIAGTPRYQVFYIDEGVLTPAQVQVAGARAKKNIFITSTKTQKDVVKQAIDFIKREKNNLQ